MLLSLPLSFTRIKTSAPLGKGRDGARGATAAFLERDLLKEREHRGVIVIMAQVSLV